MVRCLKCEGMGIIYKDGKRETCFICLGKGKLGED